MWSPQVSIGQRSITTHMQSDGTASCARPTGGMKMGIDDKVAFRRPSLVMHVLLSRTKIGTQYCPSRGEMFPGAFISISQAC